LTPDGRLVLIEGR